MEKKYEAYFRIKDSQQLSTTVLLPRNVTEEMV
jgi:hypothetical protein